VDIKERPGPILSHSAESYVEEIDGRMMLRATLSGCNRQIGKAASKIGQNGKHLLRRPRLP